MAGRAGLSLGDILLFVALALMLLRELTVRPRGPRGAHTDWDQVVLAEGEVLVLTSVRPLSRSEFSDIQSAMPEWLHDRVIFIDGTSFETAKLPAD